MHGGACAAAAPQVVATASLAQDDEVAGIAAAAMAAW